MTSFTSSPRSSSIPKITKVAKDWRAVPPCSHFVQLYRSETELIEPLAAFAADGIWQSERVIIIATAEHRTALEAALRRRGIDAHSTISTQQLTLLDAGEMLAKFMREDRPDRHLFNLTVGALVRQITTDGRKLRAFGEMVALLWAQGNTAGAIELEKLWNELSRDRPFALFCAYPAADTESPRNGFSLADICQAHEQVIPANARGII